MKKATPYLWVLFLIGFLYMAAAVMPNAIEALKLESQQQPLRLPDMQLYGSIEALQDDFISELSEKGKGLYITIASTHDVLYPLTYAGFLFFSILMMLYKLPHSKYGFYIFLVLPVIAFFSDILENSSLIALIKDFPEGEQGHFWWYRLGFIGKWTTVIASFLSLLVLLMVWLRQVYSLKPPQ